MRTFLFLLFFLAGLPSTLLLSQVWPKEGDTLHYRIIGFTFAPEKNTGSYAVELAEGYFSNADLFEKNITGRFYGKSNRIIGKVPAFGTQYTWRVRYSRENANSQSSILYHFTTGMVPQLDTANIRVRITHPAKKFGDGYFFVDGSKTLYDMHGEAVWYLPDLNGKMKATSGVRDLKFTADNTITFLSEGNGYEISYNGDILWEGENVHNKEDDSIKGYHHELARLSNGHFMTLGYEPIVRKRPRMIRDSLSGRMMRDTSDKTNKLVNRKRYGTIWEYDRGNNLVWAWSGADYFNGPQGGQVKHEKYSEHDVHENAFYFDEKKKVIYLSFRNLSQVLVISYPSGKVLRVYDGTSGRELVRDWLFCGQHSVKKSIDGHLYLFNNGCSISEPPSVVMLKEPGKKDDSLGKVWEFPCPVSVKANTSRAVAGNQPIFTSGGSIMELPDESFLVSTSTPYSTVFIVNRRKDLLWRCECEKWVENRKEWTPLLQYRTSFVLNDEQLAGLIWKGNI